MGREEAKKEREAEEGEKKREFPCASGAYERQLAGRREIYVSHSSVKALPSFECKGMKSIESLEPIQ